MADVTLAAIPLGIRAFTSCVEGYKLFTDAKQIGQGSQVLLWKFRIQETRFRMWGREWGLLVQSGSQSLAMREPEDHRVVLETLIHISDLLKDYKALKRRYGLSLVSDDPGVISQMTIDSLDEFILEEFESFRRQDTDLCEQRSKASSILRKFRWATSDKSKLETMVSDLKDYNDGLYQLLSTMERRSLRQGLGAEIITTNNLSELAEIQSASTAYENVTQVAALRRQNLAIRHSNQLVPSEELQIPGKYIAFETATSSNEILGRAIAVYSLQGQSVNVLVQWKHFDRDANDSARVSQLSRLDSLARILNAAAKPTGLCVPQCLGYISDNWHPRVGFIFEFPASKSWKSLHDLFENDAIPFLGDRFNLALKLSLSLSLLHTSGWLHKGIRSQNIIFANEANSMAINETMPSLDNPAVLGFEYSRPDILNIESDLVVLANPDYHLYQHPCAQGPARERYSRAYDIYSLGIVLLEIGYWRRISEFWHDDYNKESFREDLCTFHVPNLGPKVGKIYMEVVQKCLSGELTDERTDESGSQKGFYWTVVRELGRLVA